MSTRIDKTWIVFSSVENNEHDRCVDIFARPDGRFGFEEFRRDVEDGGEWTPTAFYSGTHYATADAAYQAAEEAIDWFREALRKQPALKRMFKSAASGPVRHNIGKE